jgi:hypothetical protein
MKASSLLLSLSILSGSGITFTSGLALAGGPTRDSASPSAGPGSDAEVSPLVEAELLKPLAQREDARSRYSRARMPPAARQVRVLDGRPEKDAQGRAFVRFAVDEKRFAEWNRNAMVGCAYLDDRAVFIKRGERVESAAQYLGKGGPRATTECTAAGPSSKQ